MSIIKFSIYFSILASIVCCSSSEKDGELPSYHTPDFTPHFNESSILSPHQISNFSFTNQHGKNITEKDISGKVHIANFIFTSCGSICPVMTKNMMLVNDSFKENSNVSILSYSVTPWEDTPQRLNKYAKDRNINNPNWHFLTGTKGKIYELARQSYFAEEDLGYTKDSTEFLHTEHFILVDQNKTIRGIYNGTLLTDIDQLKKDIQSLL